MYICIYIYIYLYIYMYIDASGEMGEGLELHLVSVNKSAGCLVDQGRMIAFCGLGCVCAGVSKDRERGGISPTTTTKSSNTGRGSREGRRGTGDCSDTGEGACGGGRGLGEIEGRQEVNNGSGGTERRQKKTNGGWAAHHNPMSIVVAGVYPMQKRKEDRKRLALARARCPEK